MADRAGTGSPPLLVGVLVAALGWSVFSACAASWTTHFLGAEYVDAWGTQWFYWWVGRQVQHGEGLGFTDVLFFPWGKQVYLHTGGNVVDAFAALGVRWVLGPVAGYNVFAMLLLVGNGLSMFRLARALGVPPPAAWLAATLFAFNPFALHELADGRPTQAMLCFLVLFLAEVVRCLEGRGGWAIVRAAAFLALTSLGYWFYAFFGGVAALAVGLWAAARAPRHRRFWILGRLGAAAGLAVLLTLPFAWPMLRAQGSVPGLLDESQLSLTAWRPLTREGVGIGIYVFDVLHRVSGFLVESKDEPGALVFVPEDTTVLRVQVVMALLGLAAAPSRWRYFLVVIAGVALVFAVGPVAQAGSLLVPNLLYLALVMEIPLLRRLWWPQRALAVLTIALAVGSAFLFARLGRRGSLLAAAAAVLATGAWVVELRAAGLAPMPTWSAAVPTVYRCLARAGDPGAIVELPYASTQAHLFYQAVHGRKIFGGMVEDNVTFTPPEQVEFRRTNSLVRTLISAAADEAVNEVPTAADVAAVGELGYRYVLFDKTAYPAPGDAGARVDTRGEGRARPVMHALVRILGPPVYEDQASALWAPWGGTNPCSAPES